MFGNIDKHSHSGGIAGLLLRVVLRFFQFILALTVAGLYGVDLHHAHNAHAYTDSKWVYAEVVAGLSAVTVTIYAIPFLPSPTFFLWDAVLFILWTALFGVFGHIYIPAHADGDAGVTRMQHAVWVDLASMLLWLVTAGYGLGVFLARRRARTLHTGRAEI